MAKKGGRLNLRNRIRKKRVLSRSTKGKGAKKVVKANKKKTAKGTAKKKPAKKQAARSPVTGKLKAKTKATQNDSVWYYNQLKKYVARHYKEQTGEEKMNRVYLEAQTRSAFKQLKELTGGNIDSSSFKAFINNLDQIISRPTRREMTSDEIEPGIFGFHWWLIDDYFRTRGADIALFKSVTVDLQAMVGPNEIWQSPKGAKIEKDLPEIRRQVAKLVARAKLDDSSLAPYFHVIKAKDKSEILFELNSAPPDSVLDKDDMGEEPEEEPTEEAPAPKKRGPKPKGEKEKPVTKGKEPQPPPAPTKTEAELKREEKKGNLELLTLKRESFEKSIKFNTEQIKDITDTIKIFKEIGISYKNEANELKQIMTDNQHLRQLISKVNDQISDL